MFELWMLMLIYVPFKIIVITRRWESKKEKLSENNNNKKKKQKKTHTHTNKTTTTSTNKQTKKKKKKKKKSRTVMNWIPPLAWSEVGSARHSATQTLNNECLVQHVHPGNVHASAHYSLSKAYKWQTITMMISKTSGLSPWFYDVFWQERSHSDGWKQYACHPPS